MKIAKEIGLFDWLNKNSAPDTVINIPTTSKEAVLGLFFTKGFDLKGKVPKEMLK